MITQEKIKELFDYENGSLIWKARSNARVKAGDVAGTITYFGYIAITIHNKKYRAHRLVFQLLQALVQVLVEPLLFSFRFLYSIVLVCISINVTRST